MLAVSTMFLTFYECDRQGNCRLNPNLKITNEFKKIGR